jgi:hypothetical protein
MPDIAALTDGDGRFSFGVPVAGSYRLEAYGETGHAAETVAVGPGARAEVRLVLVPPEVSGSDG